MVVWWWCIPWYKVKNHQTNNSKRATNKNTSYFPLYWLDNGDHYWWFMKWSLHNWVLFHPLYTLNNPSYTLNGSYIPYIPSCLWSLYDGLFINPKQPGALFSLLKTSCRTSLVITGKVSNDAPLPLWLSSMEFDCPPVKVMTNEVRSSSERWT